MPPDPQCAHAAHAATARYVWHHLLLVSKAPKLHSTMTHSLCSQTRPSCPVCLSPDCPAFLDLGWLSPRAQPDVCARPCFSSSLMSPLFPWVPRYLSPPPSFSFLCLDSSSICGWLFRIPYLIKYARSCSISQLFPECRVLYCPCSPHRAENEANAFGTLGA